MCVVEEEEDNEECDKFLLRNSDEVEEYITRKSKKSKVLYLIEKTGERPEFLLYTKEPDPDHYEHSTIILKVEVKQVIGITHQLTKVWPQR